MAMPPIKADSPLPLRQQTYADLEQRIRAMLDDERDWVSAMATVVCELHHGFDYFHWTGFYRQVEPRLLAVGPYQGSHGCLRIPFERGVCGACARRQETILLDDVHAFPDHIACSSSTLSELVVPVLTPDDQLLAVLDIDSDLPAAFTPVDAQGLESICHWLGERYAHATL